MNNSSARTISYDCRHYLGDRPCSWHKQSGVTCQCDHYQPIGQRVLIIKLDAIGDVLRTTCLLPVIHLGWTAPQRAALRLEQHVRRWLPAARIPGVSPLMRYRNAPNLK